MTLCKPEYHARKHFQQCTHSTISAGIIIILGPGALASSVLLYWSLCHHYLYWRQLWHLIIKLIKKSPQHQRQYGIPTLTKLASSNILWSNLSQIYYGQTQICGQIVAYICSKPNIWSNFICSNSNTWPNKSYDHFPHIWSNMQQKFKKIPLHNSHGYDVSIS